MNNKPVAIPYQAVFFDFDGVILDSVEVKTRAFAQIFRAYGPEAEKVGVDYHLANGGLSRYRKFDYVFKTVLNRSPSGAELQKLGEKFSELSLQRVLEAPFMPGALETLRELKANKIPTFVVSGTPEQEIKAIVRHRGLADYFREVRGSPQSKEDIVADILIRYDFEAEQCLFIGDSISDYETAKKTGLDFLGVVKAAERSALPEEVAGNQLTATVKIKKEKDKHT